MDPDIHARTPPHRASKQLRPPTPSDHLRVPAEGTARRAWPGRALKRAGAWLRQGLGKAACALERAEKRITENFRVPPHGG